MQTPLHFVDYNDLHALKWPGRLEMKQLYQILKSGRKGAGLTLQDVANTLGVSPQAVSAWEADDIKRRRVPGYDKVAALSTLYSVEKSLICELSGYNVSEIDAFGAGSPRSIAVKQTNMPGIIRVAMEVLESSNVSPSKALSHHMLDHSMMPEIPRGADVLIDTDSRTVIDGRVYAIRIGEEVVLRKIFKAGGGQVLVRASSNDWPDVTANLSAVDIIGKAFWLSAPL